MMMLAQRPSLQDKQLIDEQSALTRCYNDGRHELSQPSPRPPWHVAANDVEQHSLRHVVGIVPRGNLVRPNQRRPAVQGLQGSGVGS